MTDYNWRSGAFVGEELISQSHVNFNLLGCYAEIQKII